MVAVRTDNPPPDRGGPVRPPRPVRSQSRTQQLSVTLEVEGVLSAGKPDSSTDDSGSAGAGVGNTNASIEADPPQEGGEEPQPVQRRPRKKTMLRFASAAPSVVTTYGGDEYNRRNSTLDIEAAAVEADLESLQGRYADDTVLRSVGVDAPWSTLGLLLADMPGGGVRVAAIAPAGHAVLAGRLVVGDRVAEANGVCVQSASAVFVEQLLVGAEPPLQLIVARPQAVADAVPPQPGASAGTDDAAWQAKIDVLQRQLEAARATGFDAEGRLREVAAQNRLLQEQAAAAEAARAAAEAAVSVANAEVERYGADVRTLQLGNFRSV